MPGVRTTRTTPVPSARTPAAIGGRFGPRRTTSSRVYRTRTGTAVLVGQAAGDGGRPRWRPCRRTPRRWRAASPARRPARTTTRRARGSPARPTSSAACAPSRRRARRPATSAARSCAGPAPCRRGARASVSVSATCHVAVVAADRRRARRRARVSSAKPPLQRDRAPTRCGVPPSSGGPRAAPASRRRRPDRAGSNDSDGLDDRLPAGAAAEVGGQRPVHGRRRRARASGVSAATRITMPGVQNPHCDAPAAANAAAHAVGVGQAVERRDVAPGDAGERRHARDAGLAVDPDRAAAALALGAAAVLRRCARRGGRAGLRGGRRRRRRPRRAAPSRRNEISRSSARSRRCGWRSGS